jgi:hypothetical protein
MHKGKKTYQVTRRNGLWNTVEHVATVSHMNDGWISFKDEAGITIFCISSYECLWYKLLTPEVDSE